MVATGGTIACTRQVSRVLTSRRNIHRTPEPCVACPKVSPGKLKCSRSGHRAVILSNHNGRRARKTADRTIRGPRNAVDFAAGWSGKKAPGLARHIGHTQLIAARDAVIIFVGGTGRFGSLVSFDKAVNCGTLFDDARNGCRYQQARGQAIRTRGVIRRAAPKRPICNRRERRFDMDQAKLWPANFAAFLSLKYGRIEDIDCSMIDDQGCQE